MKYYWKELEGGRFRLLYPDGTIQDFATYEALYDFCKINNIDAKQA